MKYTIDLEICFQNNYIPCIMDQVEKLRRWLFPIGGGAYGVKTLKPINPNERSSLSVRVGRFTINAGFRYVYRGLNRINC